MFPVELGYGFLSVSFLVLSSCGQALPAQLQRNSEGSDVQESALESAPPSFSVCDNIPFETHAPGGFASTNNALFAQQTPYHNAQDIIGVPYSTVQADGTFTYGWTHHGLDHEAIGFKVNTCDHWETVASSQTDGGGYATASFKVGAPGRYRLVEEVVGDGSGVSTHLSVLPAGTHAVLFDIDGTLTTDNGQLAKSIFNSSYVAHSFPGAVAATQAWAKQGYIIIYLTGRPVSLAAMTRAWLNSQGYAPGHLHFAEHAADVQSSNSGVGAYKLAYLRQLQQFGLHVDYAYGNELTDVFAYLQAGLDAANVYILGPLAGAQKTQPLPDGYAEHLEFIERHEAAPQPFIVAQ